MNQGSCKYCRELFERGAYSNISYLINKRYSFIKQNIGINEKGIEFGAGAGLSQFFLKDYNLLVTDFCKSEWLCKKSINAQDSGFEDESYDYIIMSNVIHHLDKPKMFFNEANRILKPGGKIIIIEPYSSLLFKLFMSIKAHEQISYATHPLSDIYSFKNISKSDIDGNNAVGELLFKNHRIFEDKCTDFEIIYKSFEECIIFINSGGQYVKSPYIPLPIFLIKFLDVIDRFLIFLWRGMFALGLYVVIKKR